MNAGEAHGLVPCALRSRALAEEGDRRQASFAYDPKCQRQPDRVQRMATNRAGAADDPQLAAAVVPEHLAPAAGWVAGLAERVQKDIERRLAKRQRQCHIAVVWHHIILP